MVLPLSHPHITFATACLNQPQYTSKHMKSLSISTIFYLLLLIFPEALFSQHYEVSSSNLTSLNFEKTASAKKVLSPNGGKTNISFVGNGDLQNSISQDSKTQANTGLGVFFSRTWNDKERIFRSLEFDFIINVASTADSIKASIADGKVTNQRDFGSYIINPLNSKQATTFNFNLYFAETEKYNNLKWLISIINGFQLRFNASNSLWNYDSTSVNLSGFLLRIGLFHDFIPESIRLEKGYSIILGANYSFRGIFGDIRFAKNKEFRKTLLNTDRYKFSGFEANLGMRFKNVRAEVQIPMFKYPGVGVPGLTNTQFITSIRFVGGFPLKIKEKDDDDWQTP